MSTTISTSTSLSSLFSSRSSFPIENATSVPADNVRINDTVNTNSNDNGRRCSVLCYSREIFGYIHLVFMVMGITGNTLMILVLKKYRPKYTATTIYHTCIAVTDNVSLMTWSLVQWLFHAYNINAGILGLVFCRCYYFLVYFSIQASCWFLVAITIDRVTCVIFPLRVKSICSIKTSKIVIIVIYTFVGLCNLYTLIGVQFVYGETQACVFYAENEFDIMIDEIRSLIFAIAMFIIPFIIIFVCNIMIISQLVKVYYQRKNMSTMPVKFDVSLTITIVILCLFFLATIFPLYTMNTFDVKGDEDFEDIAELFMNINAVSNFYLYFISGSTFRKDVKKLLFKCCLNGQMFRSSGASYTPNCAGHIQSPVGSYQTTNTVNTSSKTISPAAIIHTFS